MISLRLRQQQGLTTSTQPQNIQSTGAYRRVLTDQLELQQEMPSQITIKWPDPENVMYFEAIVKPDENLWKGASFSFTITVGDEYPIQPPKVLCKRKIFHPNLDLDGKVCLNILREDWKPVSSLKDIMFGLLFLFLTPNPSDPLNKEAAELMLKDKNEFSKVVYQTLRGGNYNGINYDKVI